jgi:hypothetical protein
MSRISITIAHLYERDNGICGICGKSIKDISEANREHVIPKSMGGKNHKSNLVIAHIKCNSRRGNGGGSNYIDVFLKVGNKSDWKCLLCGLPVEKDWKSAALTDKARNVAHRPCLEARSRAGIK